MAIYKYKTKIRYNDINENNELSDKGLLNIVSEAAGQHSQEVGYGLNSIEKTNCAWMILYWKAKIFKRPKWNTELTVETWPSGFDKVVTWREFEVYDPNKTQIAIVSSQWISVDNRDGKILRLTDKMINDYGIVDKKVFEETLNSRIKEPENMQKIYEYIATRRDIDVNHHVNNIIYLEFAYNALPKENSIDYSNLEIYYKKQIKLGEKVAVYYTKENNKDVVAIKSIDGQTLHAILKFY